jgi:hypothetical protein
MKQLLLNFLFFVGSAIILVQCAKLFPTTDKSSKQQSQNQAKIDYTIFSRQTNAALAFTNTALAVTNAASFKFSFKNKQVRPLFNNSGFPYNMMAFINYHSLFYRPYMSLNYFGLGQTYRGKPQRKK